MWRKIFFYIVYFLMEAVVPHHTAATPRSQTHPRAYFARVWTHPRAYFTRQYEHWGCISPKLRGPELLPKITEHTAMNLNASSENTHTVQLFASGYHGLISVRKSKDGVVLSPYFNIIVLWTSTPCLVCLKVPSFFTLSPSHQFLTACMEY
jgi:hypothetical protein